MRGGVYRSVAAIVSRIAKTAVSASAGTSSKARTSSRSRQVGGRWRLHGWGVFSDTTGNSEVPSYMLPSLGGSTTLRSFSDYRFHDRHMLLPAWNRAGRLFEHVDAALFVDAGGVAPRVRDLGFRETSVGAGVRVHVRSTTIGRIDVAHGREGWRVLMRLNEPFRLNRLSRRNAAIPFVP